MRPFVLGLAGLCIGFFACATANAAVPPPFDLGNVNAKRIVKDVILDRPPKLAQTTRAAAKASFTDDAGNAITIDSSIPGVDLERFASVLNATYHGTEIAALRVHVVMLSQMATICGDPDAIACYLAADPAKSADGQIWIANDDTDWVHSLVHEYGHHMDNQLFNLGHLHRWGIGKGCSFSGDGSRKWFFARQLEDDILGSGFSCDADSDWDYLLPELFAEDFVAFNRINEWQLTSARSPTSSQLRAMKWDIDNGLYWKVRRYSFHIGSRRMRFRTVSTPNINFLRVRVSGASGRDFDVYVFKHNKVRYTYRSIHGGRIETYLGWLPPGKWDIGVYAFRKGGLARVEIDLL